MKKNYLIITFSIICAITTTDIVVAQETNLIAENKIAYEIENGKVTAESKVVSQTTYNLDKLPVRKIFFDGTKVKGYIFFFHDQAGKLIGKDFFNKDNNPIKIIRYYYNDDNKLISEKLYNIEDNKTKLDTIIRYKYNDNLQLIEVEHSDNKGKWMIKTEIEYDEGSNTIETSKFHKRRNKSNKSKLIRTNIYENDSLLSESKTIIQYIDGTKTSMRKTYKYNEQDSHPTQLEIFNENELSKTIKYRLHKDGYVMSKAVLDSNNIFIEYFDYKRNWFNKDPGQDNMIKVD